MKMQSGNYSKTIHTTSGKSYIDLEEIHQSMGGKHLIGTTKETTGDKSCNTNME